MATGSYLTPNYSRSQKPKVPSSNLHWWLWLKFETTQPSWSRRGAIYKSQEQPKSRQTERLSTEKLSDHMIWQQSKAIT
ncbi:hypothetical protein TNCV_4362771 [Trichonephila clavipes]|nr:hypothetical protein TNCV_4362771 [Trichonephila clavipes]